MTCTPLIIHRDGTYQAWCPQHRGWESGTYAAPSWARAAAEQHQQEGQA